MTTIVVASTSQIKLNAVQSALAQLNIEAEIIGVKAQSGVAEQPFDDETVTGARQRLADAERLHPQADCYIAIENGIFHSGEDFIDKAVVVAGTSAQNIVRYSDGVAFPADCVKEAEKIGFDKITVGKVMKRRGIVVQHDDPHLTLAGKSRSAFLAETVLSLFKDDLGWKSAQHPGMQGVVKGTLEL